MHKYVSEKKNIYIYIYRINFQKKIITIINKRVKNLMEKINLKIFDKLDSKRH